MNCSDRNEQQWVDNRHQECPLLCAPAEGGVAERVDLGTTLSVSLPLRVNAGKLKKIMRLAHISIGARSSRKVACTNCCVRMD
jgi:hypothetical protein